MASIDRDPFSDTTDPNAYIPRTATESALVLLEMALCDGARVVSLCGPTGSGKTLLLNVLEERLGEEFRALRVPYPKLDPLEFCQWGLATMGVSAAGDPERALAERIASDAAAGEPPLVWIVDDADSLPLPTLCSLLSLQRTTGDALHLLLARSGDLPSEELAQAGVVPVNIELEGEMDSAEMSDYVRTRLDRAGVDPWQRAEVEVSLDQLYERSQGNPRRLHAAASALLCFGPGRLDAMVAEQSALTPRRVESDAPCDKGAEIARNESERAQAIGAAPIAAERISIESLVAEAVAAEQPLEELAIHEPTTVLVATPVPEEPAAEPAPVEPPPESEPPSGDSPSPVPRKRFRLRRLGRH